MKYRMSAFPAMEKTNESKGFLFKTREEMIAARDTSADLLLFLQDDPRVMQDYSNMFFLEEMVGDVWEEYDESLYNN